jgi:hypothetical protein
MRRPGPEDKPSRPKKSWPGFWSSPLSGNSLPDKTIDIIDNNISGIELLEFRKVCIGQAKDKHSAKAAGRKTSQETPKNHGDTEFTELFLGFLPGPVRQDGQRSPCLRGEALGKQVSNLFVTNTEFRKVFRRSRAAATEKSGFPVKDFSPLRGSK